LNASKDRFGVMIYHVEDWDSNNITPIPREKIKPILFLSKILTLTESKYGPSELEIACLIWTVRRIKHMIEAAKKTIIYTDHASNVLIVLQTTLRTANVDKLNPRLIRASQYLSQFNIKVRWKPGKAHIVPDALSRLPVKKTNEESEDEAVLDLPAFVYLTTTVEMTSETKSRIKKGYRTEQWWKRIYETLQNETASARNFPSGLGFVLKDDLIYYTRKGKDQLCMPQSMKKEIFKGAYDRNAYFGLQRSFERISETLYFRHLVKRLRKYIKTCHTYATHQTKRHAPYGQMVPIRPPDIPFHTIAIDFIDRLPSEKGYDALLSVTDKFTKRILLVPGKMTRTAEEWAEALIDALRSAD
jgi:RNase H-like domain found in reverse transcriptase/Integrase zinc binding domain